MNILPIANTFSLAATFMKLCNLILVCLFPTFALGQQFNYAQIKTKEIDSLRKINNAHVITYDYPIGVSSDYFPNRAQFVLAQPIIYRKKIKSFENETSFYFSKSDSVVRLIEYQWEGSSKSTDLEYYEIVKGNKKVISDFFHSLPVEVPETDEKAAKSIWENESVYVEQLIMPGLQRIRVLISWK